jgi:hypothetical protein
MPLCIVQIWSAHYTFWQNGKTCPKKWKPIDTVTSSVRPFVLLVRLFYYLLEYLLKYFFRWPLVNFNINEFFCLNYSLLMDLINTLFFINQRFLRFWRFDDILMYKHLNNLEHALFAPTNTAAGSEAGFSIFIAP